MITEQPAKEGRIDSYYSYKTINSEGTVTIEATIAVRDQSFESASVALMGALEGLVAPAKLQVKE